MEPTPPLHVISLARTPDRLVSFRADNPDLRDWRVFTAIDGATVDPATRDALGDTALWSAGGVGAALSHIALWRLCIEGREALTVCEDDAVLRRDFRAASAALLKRTSGFDIVLWGWNFDAVMEAELAPGACAAVLGDQTALRRSMSAFRDGVAAPTLLRLRKALGAVCYTISPAGAAKLLARALPVRPVRLALPLMAHEIGNVTFDVTVASLFGQMDAHIALPPLAATRNEWDRSTVRLPAPLAPRDALARAEALQTDGRLQDAVALIQSAASAAPREPALWGRLGLLLAEGGHLAAAAAALERALTLSPSGGTESYNLARVRLLQDRVLDALDLLERAVRLSPDLAPAHCNRGVALLALGRAAEALAPFATAIALDARLLEAQRGLAAARLSNGDLAGAVEAQAAAVALAPGDGGLLEDLARLQLKLAAQMGAAGELQQAADLCALVARTPPCRLEALITGSDLMERLGRFQESWAMAGHAVQLQPRSPQAQTNLGVGCLRLDRPLDAERAFRAAVALAPDDAQAHHGLAFALLKQGRASEGWPEYEWRLRTPAMDAFTRSFERPVWRGEIQPDATLLLVAEQGLGDTLQAACLIAEARPRVGRVVVQAPASLVSLLRRMPGVDAVVGEGAVRPPHDLWLPLMSLPGRLDIALYRRPPTVAPLRADPALTAAWAQRLAPGGFRIGIAWQGSLNARVEHGRSFPLAVLAPLASRPDVVLVSLQKGAGREQLYDRPPALAGVIDLGEPYRRGDFEDTAAVMTNLDLVVCSDTAVAHLAGALGRPVWIALGENPDWRWPQRRAETPWYASARLFHRNPAEPWETLFARMAEALNEHVETRPSPGSRQ